MLILAAAMVLTSAGNSSLQAAHALDIVVEETFAQMARHLRADVPITETDAVEIASKEMTRQGLVTDEPPLVAFGRHSGDPAWTPNDTTLRKGDVVLVEVAARRDAPGSIYADVTWTAYAGAARAVPTDVAKAWMTVRDARDRAIAAIESAASEHHALSGADADAAARNVVERAYHGTSYPHATGHALGEKDQDAGPNLSQRDSRPLAPGECVTVEPGVYTSKWGVRSGVDVCLGTDGAEVTSAIVQREIRPLSE